MAKNTNNDEEGGIIIKRTTTTGKNLSEKLSMLDSHKSILVWSFILIGLITLVSFLIEDKGYHKNFNLLFLNLELLIIFARDIYLYYKKSCRIIKSVLILMSSIYIINIVDLLFNIPHEGYLMGCCGLIALFLSVIWILGYKNQ